MLLRLLLPACLKLLLLLLPGTGLGQGPMWPQPQHSRPAAADLAQHPAGCCHTQQLLLQCWLQPQVLRAHSPPVLLLLGLLLQ
jgi:hypothetical protein